MRNRLPKGWDLLSLMEVCESVSRIKSNQQKKRREFLYLDIGSIDNSTNRIKSHKVLKWDNAPSRAQQIVQKNDILFSTVRTYLKNIALITSPEYDDQIASSGFTVLRAKKNILHPKFLFYQTISNSFLEPLNNLQTGSSYPAVRDNDVLSQKITVPPFKEQEQIVLKIEELFSELDKSIEQLKTVQQQLKVYQQAVLKWAFEGRLTNENVRAGKLPQGWKVVHVRDLCDVVRGGSPRPAGDLRFYEGTIPFLKVADLTRSNSVYLYSHTYTIKEAGLSKTRQIKPNTLLLSNSGATLGVPKICMIDATMNDGVAAFLNLDKRSNLFLYYFWKSKTEELRNLNQGAAQPNLNTDVIKNYECPYCSLEEQGSVVREIENRLSVIEQIEETIKINLHQVQALRQSILKKAFEGHLI